jgi:AmpD protein
MKFEIDKKTGRVHNVKFVPSPNCDERPHEDDIHLLVIHGISLPPNQFGGPYIEQLFTNTLAVDDHPYFKEICHLNVSSHLLIRRDGEVLQFVPLHKRAWHAGQSQFCGREKCNDFSIGIELEGADDIPYENIQYDVLAELTQAIRAAYPAIINDNIVGHCDIAPERKTDPGLAFDWQRYRTSLA